MNKKEKRLTKSDKKKKSKPVNRTPEEITKDLLKLFKVATDAPYSETERSNFMIINTLEDKQAEDNIRYYVLGWFPSKTKSLKDLKVFEVLKNMEMLPVEDSAFRKELKEMMMPDTKEVVLAIKMIMEKIYDVETAKEQMILNNSIQ